MFSESLGHLVVYLNANTLQYRAALTAAQQFTAQVATQITLLGRRMFMSLTLPIALIGGMAIKAFAKFDDAMNQSLAIMGKVPPKIRAEMEQTAKDIASKSITAPEKLAESYFFLASAGMSAQQSMKALPVVEKFAVAGMFDMQNAVTLLNDSMSALGMKTEDATQNMIRMREVGDVLVKANTLANATVEQFATSLTSKAGAAMKAYNISLREGVAVLAAYADKGIKAELAGNMMGRMLRLTIKAIVENESAWKKFNIRTQDAEGNLPPLADLIEDITAALEGMGAVQKAAALEMLGFKARSQQTILPLLGASNAIRDYYKELEKANGITKEVAEKQLMSFISQMKILWNNIKLMGIEIGAVLAPALVEMATYIKGLTQWFRGLSDTTKAWIVGGAIFVAMIGLALLVVGSLATAISSLIGLLATVGIVGLAFAAALVVVATAILFVVDAFSAGELGLIELVRSFRLFGIKVGTIIDMVSSDIVRTWDWMYFSMLEGFEVVYKGLRKGFHDIYTEVLNLVQGVASILDNVLGTGLAVKVDSLIANEEKAYAASVGDSIGKLKELREERKKNDNYWSAAQAQLIKDDVKEKTLAEETAAQRKKDIEGQINLMRKKMELAKAGGMDSSGLGLSTTSEKEFKTMSLRRFSLASVESGSHQTQEVRDEGVIAKLDELISKMHPLAQKAILG